MRTKTAAAALLLACAVLALATLLRPAASTAAPNPAITISAVPSPSLSALPHTPSPTIPWYPADCATGAFGAARVEEGHLLVPATITHCGTWQAAHTFTLVSFNPDSPPATVHPGRLRSYAQAGPTDVTAEWTPPPDGPTGLCLMRSTQSRVACVRVENGTATAIAPTDPLVDKPVGYDKVVTMEQTTPFCGTCLVMPP